MNNPAPSQLSEVLFIPLDCIPEDHARQVHADAAVTAYLAGAGSASQDPVVLDLGCGQGDSVDLFRREWPAAKWIGVDIEGSPEVLSRQRTDAEFRTFDGVHIPAPDCSVDIVFCKQAVTHAAEVLSLFREVRRILKTDGVFIGSTSHLEPTTSYSRTNLTPYGLESKLTKAGLRLDEIRPGIDAITLIFRRLFWKPWLFDRFYESESPLNRLVGVAGKLRRKPIRAINTRKLLFAGQYVFRARVHCSADVTLDSPPAPSSIA